PHDITARPVIRALALTPAASSAAQVTTAERNIMALTPTTVARVTTMAVDPLTRTTTTRVGRPGDITRTHIGAAVTRTAVTTTTPRTTRQHMAITRRWLRPYSGALTNSVITTA